MDREYYPPRDPDEPRNPETDDLPYLLHDFFVKLGDALSGYAAHHWREGPRNEDGTPNGIWEYQERRREWFRVALRRLILAGLQNRIDVGPFRWFEKFIHGDRPWDAENAILAVDATRNLMLLCSGEDGRYYRVRGAERAAEYVQVDVDSDENDGDATKAAAVSDPPAPLHYLTNWRSIIAELNLKPGAESRNQIRAAHKSFEGPIVLPGQGGQPKVEKTKLLIWWNSLEAKYAEAEARARDRDASVEATHAYGRDGDVVPEISGGIKRRRVASTNITKRRKT